jgi:hypothetical protein
LTTKTRTGPATAGAAINSNRNGARRRIVRYRHADAAKAKCTLPSDIRTAKNAKGVEGGMMRTRIVMLGLALLCASAGPAAGQCCGDCAGDGSVTIDDLIRAVNNALGGCPQETPTVGPSPTRTRVPTNTRKPTATRTPADRCSSTFNTQGNNLCLFRGTYNRSCGTAVNSTFSSNGSVLVVTIATGLPDPPTVSFSANVTQGSRATLTGWSTDNFQTVRIVTGAVRLNDDRRQLEVFPDSSPFFIGDCAFVQYLGEFQNAAAAADDDSADAAFAQIEARGATPIPRLGEE